MDDEAGLLEAYNTRNGLYARNDTLYVAGTKSLQDVWDDIKIPFGKVSASERYGNAYLVLEGNPQIHNAVGHSLGASVALELEKQGKVSGATRTYSAPVISASGGERYRTLGDPIAAFDFGAHTYLPRNLNAHSYGPLANGRNMHH